MTKIEINKMFENAGIKGEWRDYRTKNGKIYEGKNPKNRNIRLCKPDFTAEKQIELIKLLTRQCDLTISYFTKWKWEFVHYDGQDPLQVRGKDFAETFAKLINAYWQNLTDQEKEEIRNILNENS